MSEREPGYYWVEWRGWGKQTVAYWSEIKRWLVPGQEPLHLDSDAIEIGPCIDRDETERLKARVAELEAALEVRAWTAEESDGMMAAFKRASEKHGDYESLFAVAAFILRHRARTALKGSE